ncbi:hypothetical protein [Vibrio cortegadensis]|uniref:hypothetical protein n=1 Tax=Vibrio cortegadensis TaxID=1328770 RepID=UPI0021C41D1B|nr:hypothetical protein [Vibrio cortegadensis]
MNGFTAEVKAKQNLSKNRYKVAIELAEMMAIKSLCRQNENGSDHGCNNQQMNERQRELLREIGEAPVNMKIRQHDDER